MSLRRSWTALKERARARIDFNQSRRDAWVAEKAATLPPKTRVLDAGAGTCRYRLFFGHCDYVTQDFCGIADREWPYGAIDIVSDICSIPLPENSVDVVLCTEVLEHIPDPPGAIAEFSRLLKTGGKLWLTVPLGSGLHQKPHHFYGGFTPYWIRRFLTINELDVVTIKPNGGFFSHYGQETARLHAMLFRRKRSLVLRALLSLPGMASFLLLRLAAPVLFRALDPLDADKDFTVGYFVEALRRERKGDPSCAASSLG